MSKSPRGHEQRRLTPKQLRVLTLIRDGKRRNGFSPTMQELADDLGVSKVTVFEHVEALLRKGLLRRMAHKARSLELTDHAVFPDQSGAQIPLAGRIAAGHPIEAIEDTETLDLETVFASRCETYVLEVQGDSMIDAHIQPGDFVVVERRNDPRNGDITVVLLQDGEATLKAFHRQGPKIRLQPANEGYEPIWVTPGEIEIQGVVVGVVRRY